MAGETTVLHLPFAGGLDELVSKEYLDASARQASILNGDFVKAGSISKRPGLEYISTELVPGGSLDAPTSGARVIGWSRSSLSLIGSGKFYQHTKTPIGGGNGGLVGLGPIPNVGAVRRPLPLGSHGVDAFGGDVPTLCDLEYSGRLLRISLFRNPIDFYASVYDADSEDIVLPPTLVEENVGELTYVVSAFSLPSAPGGPVAIVVFHDDISGEVRYSKYDPSSNTFSALVTMVAADVTTVDAAPYEDDPSSGWLVFYDVGGTGGAAGDTLRLAYWTLDGQQTYVDQAVEAFHDLESGAYVCGRYGASVWTAWKTSTTSDFYWAQRRAADSVLTTATSPVDFQYILTPGGFVLTGLAHLGTDKVFVSFRLAEGGDGSNWGTYMSGWHVLSHSSGTVSSIAFGQIPFGLIALTRPFVVGGEVFQPFVYNLSNSSTYGFDPQYECKQGTLYLCKFYGVSDSMTALGTVKPNRCLPVATAAPRQVSVVYQNWEAAFGNHCGMPSSVSRDSSRVAVGIRTRGTVDSISQTESNGPAWSVEFSWDDGNLYQVSELGNALSISSGVPFITDGRSVFEDGFFNYPEFTYATPGSGGLPEGDYTCAVVYKYTDATGAVHQSAPYILDPITVEADSKLSLSITPPIGTYLDFFAEDDSSGQISAEVYVTQTNGATLFYYGSERVSNVFTADPDIPWPTSISYDVSSLPQDGAPILYTTGGVLDHVNPPASSTQITHQKRKALVDETRRGVWLTKQFTQGVAPGFNEALYIDFPEGDDIVALGSLDSRLIALKQNSIWYIDGQGPSPNGLGASWTDPERIPSDVGCASWQSVVSMPNGLMFQGSDKGIYLLGRDLTVSFVGRNVVDSTTAYPNIVSATLVPSSSHVRFVCLDEAGTSHLVVVYDYLLNAWTTHRYDHLSDVPVAVCMSSDPAPRYSVLSADGQLWQERLPSDDQRYLDQDDAEETHFVPTVVAMPFVKLQVQGYHRARRVQFFGERLDDCGLQIQMAFNYDDTVRQTATWAPSQLSSLSVKGQVEAYVGAAFNKQMSMQLTFSDTEGSAMSTGAGMRFVSAAIELQNLGSRYKLLGAGARR